MRYLTTNLSKKQRMLRLIGSALVACVMCLSLLNLRAFAAGGIEFTDLMQLAGYIKDNNVQMTEVNGVMSLTANINGSSISFTEFQTNKTGDSKTVDFKAPTTAISKEGIPEWGTLVNLAAYHGKIASDYPTIKRCCATASQIISTFKEQSKYNKACKDLRDLSWTYDPSTEAITPTASGDEHKLSKAITKFKSTAANASATNAFDSIYDNDNWNPEAGVAGDFMNSVFAVVNTIFYVVSNLMLWFFLLQTGFDALYIIAEPVRPFIEPRERGSGGGIGGGMNNGGSKFSLSRIHVPICSHAVQTACGESSGGIGGNQAGGGSSGNAFFKYAIARFPVLLCCAVYLILVTMGYWPKLIGWISQFAVQIIDAIMNIGK